MKIVINADNPRKIPKPYSLKWNKKLSTVKTLFDKSAIILLGEILKLFSNEDAIFTSAGKIDYDMFGSCDFVWTLSSGHFIISRQLEREISDGLQRVEVITDNVILSGFRKNQFSWNGQCGECLSALTVKLELSSRDSVNKIRALGLELYENFSAVEIK